jgi:aminopeptidase
MLRLTTYQEVTMTDVKASLEHWGLAGKPEWKKTFRQIKALSFNYLISKSNQQTTAALRDYFRAVQQVILLSGDYEDFICSGLKQQQFSVTQLKRKQNALYADLKPAGSQTKSYATCFGNPQFAKQQLGSELGGLLCLLYGRFRNYLNLIIQQRYADLAKLNRLFLDFHALAADYDGSKKQLARWNKAFRQFVETDLDKLQLFNVHWRYSPQSDYYQNIVLKADLDDFSYLFRYGVHISDHVIKMAEFMRTYPVQDLKKLAQYIVKSYQDGFERGYRSYKEKKYVMLIIPAGLERLARLVIAGLRKIGLEAVVAPPQTQELNKQYDYDQRFAMSLYYDKVFTDNMLKAYEQASQQLHDVLNLHAGPVYVELFGETPFSPVDNPAAFQLSAEQRQLMQKTSGRMTQIFYQHYKRETTSFCIIAFPSPEIGRNFRRIFADTVRINMLDSLHYAALQQKLIDVLDTAEYVHVKGKRGNQTDIRVKLHKLNNPAKETNFENCVADVNIPVGEVFTSPLLKGTNGTLHVKEVYLSNLLFRNLKLTFKDGMISAYSCTNFPTATRSRKFIEDNLLLPHKTLPIGEFAIGTNTTAYQVALKYDILGLLPILILEKMGPHFAVGDTCYTREEDIDHFNFYDGKKLIAVDNEKTALRKTDPLKAYTQVHTDITLPYDMLQSIAAVRQDGSCADIIKNGLFAVPGTEELNKPLLEVLKLKQAKARGKSRK